MHLVVNKTLSLSGKTTPPGSKSLSIRALFFALLSKGKSTLINVLDSDDTNDAISVCKALGAHVDLQGHTLTLTSHGLPFTSVANEIDTGNSGITTRFVLPLLGLRENYTTPVYMHCGAQMQQRPMKPLIDALRILGMHIQCVAQEGCFPILVSGQLTGGEVEIDGITSQYLSALLISLPCAINDSVITVKHLNERPYVEMTLDCLNQHGIVYTHQRNSDTDIFSIKGGQCYQSFATNIHGDFSSASYLLAAGSLFPGEIELHGLDMKDRQGDKQLVLLLQKMGADIIVENEKITMKGKQQLKGISIDANAIPDLVPTLAVIATQATGQTKIYNVKQARMKETDRIHSMTEGLKRMGANIQEFADGMTIEGSHLHGAFVNGYDDHRTVMALTIAGMLADGTTKITDGKAIAKTYPGFIETMQSLGARIDSNEVENKHIILIGFKHVGKTVIGKQLATSLQKDFIDLDKEIENRYEKQHAQALTCREIMKLQGESYYRNQEQEVLQEILQLPSAVIALGGGTLMDASNQEKVASHLLLHVVAPRGIVFERIMVAGRPAFFDPNEDPYASFSRLWDKRCTIYTKLTSCIVDNNASIEQAVCQAMGYLENRVEKHA